MEQSGMGYNNNILVHKLKVFWHGVLNLANLFSRTNSLNRKRKICSMCMDHYVLRQTLYFMSEYLLKSDLMNALMHLKCLLLYKISMYVCLLVESCGMVIRYIKDSITWESEKCRGTQMLFFGCVGHDAI